MSILRKRNKNDALTEYTCSIRFLDDTETIQLNFKKDTLGHWLFDRVCEKLNLVEKDYFGLRYVDPDNQRHWLDPLKTVYKQLKGISKMVLCFRVKFYPEDPMKLHEEITRYYLFLQLRRDLHHGRLLCSPEDSIQLAAYIIQSEVGDYDPQDHPIGYVSNFKMLPKQSARLEDKIMEAHKALVGKVPSECEGSFLKKAASMDTYGVDPHQVKDQKGESLYLGVTHLGVMTFRGNRRTQLFKWNQIKRVAYEGKMFILNYNSSDEPESNTPKKKHQAVGYKCQTTAAAKYLWRCAVEQQLFFTLSSSSAAPKVRSGGNLFSRGSKFRFSGRCQNEAYEASENIRRTEPPFSRTSSLPNFAKRSHHSLEKNNSSFRNSALSSSLKNEAAVDVPTIVTEAATVTVSKHEIEPAPKVQAPLAEIEAFDEKQQQLQTSTIVEVNPAIKVAVQSLPLKHSPPPSQVQTPSTPPTTPTPVTLPEDSFIIFHQPVAYSSPLVENGQVVRDTSAVLETSLDDFIPYEPNQTKEESDVEKDISQEEEHLDYQEEEPEVKLVEDIQVQEVMEETVLPSIQNDLSHSPTHLTTQPTHSTTQPTITPAVYKEVKKSNCGSVIKSVAVSTLIAVLLAAVVFYVVFMSSVKHPLLTTVRHNLPFLEPVKQFVDKTATQAVSFFKK